MVDLYKHVGVTISPELLEKLDQVLKSNGSRYVSRSQIIRIAIDEWLDLYKSEHEDVANPNETKPK